MEDKVIKVPYEFIDYRTQRYGEYNQGKRSDRKFLMDLDAELYEWWMINHGGWTSWDGWEVDAFNTMELTVDVKFISKYWNLSRQSVVNIIQQRTVLDIYQLMEWVSRPNRPLEVNDEVTVRYLGVLPWADAADNIRVSGKDPYGFYIDARKLIEQRRTTYGTDKTPSLTCEG